MKNFQKKEKSSAKNKVVAATLSLGLLTTGTFAWSDMKQHKTNTAMGGGLDHSVSLVDIYNPEDAKDWYVGNDISKEVRIVNEGEDSTHGKAYVRVNLKEYMEIGDAPKDVWSEDRYMINADGHHIKSDSFETLQELVEASGFEYDESKVQELEVEGEKHFYHKTDNSDANGVYGKHVRLEREGVDDVLNAKPVIEGTVRANTQDHHGDVVDESNYPSINFNEESPIRDYVKLPISSDTVLIDEFDADKHSEGIWVLDGEYAYWSNPLEPGQSTTNLVDGLTLVNDPDGAFYYDLHVELEAVDQGDINKLENLSPEIENIWKVEKEIVIPDVSDKLILEDPVGASEEEDYSPARHMFYDKHGQNFYKTAYFGKNSLNNQDIISKTDANNNVIMKNVIESDDMFTEHLLPKYSNGKLETIVAFKSYREDHESTTSSKGFALIDPNTLEEIPGTFREIDSGSITADKSFFNSDNELVVVIDDPAKVNGAVMGMVKHSRLELYDVDNTGRVDFIKEVDQDPLFENLGYLKYKDGYIKYHMGIGIMGGRTHDGEIIVLDKNFEEVKRVAVDFSEYTTQTGQVLYPMNIFDTILNHYVYEDDLFLVFKDQIQKININTGVLSKPVAVPKLKYLSVDEFGNAGLTGLTRVSSGTNGTKAVVVTPDLRAVEVEMRSNLMTAHDNFFAHTFANGRFYVAHGETGQFTPVKYTE